MKKYVPHKTDWAQIERFLINAEKKVSTARKILEFDEEACLQQAYEAMMKASLAFMFSHGSRARSIPGHHIAIIEFTEEHFGEKHTGLFAVFDQLRRKRNAAMHDETGFISRQDAEEAVKSSRKFVAIIRADVEGRKPEPDDEDMVDS